MAVWIDLTRKLGEGIPVYPGDPLFQARPFAEHSTDGFRGTFWAFGSHVGTHLDAPFHYFVDGETLDSFPLDFFFGDAAVLDLTSTVAIDADENNRLSERPTTISSDDLAPFEPIFDAVPFVFLRTGWASRFGKSDFFDAFPSLTPETADWLADFPKLRILGLETPSLVAFPTTKTLGTGEKTALATKTRSFDSEFLPEPTEETLERWSPRETPTLADGETPDDVPLDELELCADAECHRILLGRRPPILILEGLANLETLPSFAPPASPREKVTFDPKKALEIAAAPLFIERSDGCPVRVAARRRDE